MVDLNSCAVARAGESGPDDLVIAARERTDAVIVVSPDAGHFERLAAEDLAKYIGLMSGAAPAIANTLGTIAAALASDAPLLIVGQEALEAEPSLRGEIAAVLKRDPVLRTDGIALKREGNRVCLAGNNDPSHYFAVAELLRRWGCRWYVPTDFGECIPEVGTLAVGDLTHIYSSPFEVRSYWLSWHGDQDGRVMFQKHNMMTDRDITPPTGHILGKYTDSVPGSKGAFNFPITAPETARHVADQVEPMFAAGENFSLGMEDGSYDSDYPGDQELMKLQWDKYFVRWSVTDLMLELYNNIARTLQERHPDSPSLIGFLAYINMTIPPVRDMTAGRPLYCELAPIDFDPIHGMDDPQSPSRREYKDIMYEWARLMQGRLAIYDYDQGALIWRDIPNPCHFAFRQDVKHYRDAGILGVCTESRNAIGTVFLNLHMRARLLWEPELDVDVLLDEFYPKFYGPAAEPMRAYWTAIYDAWENTIITEHEYFIAPGIYTAELMTVLKEKIAEAEAIIAELEKRGGLTRNERLYVERVKFTRLSYEITSAYIDMVRAAATDCDYTAAVAAGERGLAARESLTEMGGIFTTYRDIGESGWSWWPGEVQQYRELLPFTDGTQGRLIAKLPLQWAFRRDPDDKGLSRGFADGPVDMDYWDAHKDELTHDSRKDYPDEWEMINADLYMQAQGIRHSDRHSYVGHAWYRTDVDVPAESADGPGHIRFPGLFNVCRLYVNGEEVAVREQGPLYWLNDYRFEWDVDLTGKLKPGANTIALQLHCEHAVGGMFRRPFLYAPVGE